MEEERGHEITADNHAMDRANSLLTRRMGTVDVIPTLLLSGVVAVK